MMEGLFLRLTAAALLSPASAAIADQYPISGAWAYLDSSQPSETAKYCDSYHRDAKAVVGSVIVFQGTKKTEYGGYLEEETVTNPSVRKTGPNEFTITERYYDDGEEGKPGYRRRTYRVT